jgi:hypothetical protein
VLTTLLTMKIKTKVSTFTKGRKIVEIPASVRDEFVVGEVVTIEKVK